MDKKITEREFKEDILKSFASSSKGLPLSGFLQFWEHKIKSLGEEVIYTWLHLLGYDKSLYSLRSRLFLLNIHRYS